MNTSNIAENSNWYCSFCKRYVKNPRTVELELLCDLCGFILKEEVEYSETLDVDAVAGVLSTDLTLNSFKTEIDKQSYDIGLSTTMNVYGKDYAGRVYSNKSNLNLRKTSLRAKVGTTLERNTFKGHMEATRLCKSLYIPAFIEKKVIAYYTLFSKKNLLKNRNVNSCILSLLVIFCNNYNIPLSISEALKETGVSRRKFNKDYFNLYYLFETASPTGAEVSAHLEKSLSLLNANWANLNLLKEKLSDITEKNVFRNLEGRDAIVTTGAVMYYLLKHFKYPDIDKFLKLVVLNRLTIKNKWAHLIEKYPILKEYDIAELEITEPEHNTTEEL